MEENKGAAYEVEEVGLRSTSEDQGPYSYDAEEREKRLSRGIQWKDLIMVFMAGFALISDGYQNNIMTMVNQVLTLQFPETYTSSLKTKASYASTVGTIFGQVIIGLATDYIGRKWSIVTATLFLILGSILCAASHGISETGLIWMLIIGRGVTGFGIGAEYPSSSVTASEAANESIKRRSFAFVMSTNFPLSFGGPVAISLFLIVYQITKSYDAIWRTLFAIGCFFPLSVFYFRMKMNTSLLYQKSAIKRQIPPYFLIVKYYWRKMIGTTLAWFLYDFVTFPNGVFSAGIISHILGKNSTLEETAEWQLLLSTLSLPGLFLGAYLINIIGRKNVLLIGFCGYIVFGLIVGCAYDKVQNIVPLFVVLYGLMQSSGNFGPGNCMGLISSESYASPIRGTLYGFSAAIGKVGAVVGTLTFTPIQNNLGDNWTFIIAAICGLAGIIVTFFFVVNAKDDDLLLEDIKFKNYLVSQGWNGHFGTQMDDPDKGSASTVSEDEKSELH